MPEHGLLPSARQPELRVRAARISDLDDLLRIEAATFATDRLSRRRFRAFLSSATGCLIVAERERVLGYALVLMRRGSRAARLYSLSVLPDAAGRGTGSLLLDAAEAVAVERGAASLRLEVRADNETAIRFYARHGYRAFGRREGYYTDGMAALRCSRTLRESDAARPAARPLCQAA